MKECKRNLCVWYDEKFNNNCINKSKVCTQPQTEDEYCPSFEIDNIKHNI